MTGGHSLASLRSGKAAVDSDLHLSSSTTSRLAPNVKSGQVDNAHTVIASFSFMPNEIYKDLQSVGASAIFWC